MKKILLLLVLVTNLVFARTYEEFYSALEKDDVSYIENLIKTKKLDMSLDNLLLESTRRNSKEIIKLLIKKGANIEVKDDENWTPLMCAAHFNSKEVVELLLEKGANIEAKDNEGETALIRAAYNDSKEVTKLLIKKGANINEKNNNEN